jgi:hypothetical protein
MNLPVSGGVELAEINPPPSFESQSPGLHYDLDGRTDEARFDAGSRIAFGMFQGQNQLYEYEISSKFKIMIRR